MTSLEMKGLESIRSVSALNLHYLELLKKALLLLKKKKEVATTFCRLLGALVKKW